MLNETPTNKPYRQGVFAIIIDNDNNFLLVRKIGWKDNEWTILGGGEEDGETPEDNLFRELAEEIGADIKDFNIIGLSSFEVEYDYPEELSLKINGGKYRGQSYKQFVVRFGGDKNKLVFSPKEFNSHKWARPNELIDCLVLPGQYQSHKKAIDEILPGLIK